MRSPGEPFTFAYIGTHVPAKGVHHLIEAFSHLSGQPLLHIRGRPSGAETDSLQALVTHLPDEIQGRIRWMGEYHNAEIVPLVFNSCDAIVVPSIWLENSPLVIHEALQARIPIITANAGGMAEYVRHETNGLLFVHRNPADLAAQMQRFIQNPAFARRLGERGYLDATDGNIPAMADHLSTLESLYAQLCTRRREQAHHGTDPSDPTRPLADHF